MIQESMEARRDLWEKASPISHVHEDAPPFFVIHGSHDTLALVENARTFVDALRCVSTSPVVYAELPGAQHAFEVFHSIRTDTRSMPCTCFSRTSTQTFVQSSHSKTRSGAFSSSHPQLHSEPTTRKGLSHRRA